MSIRIETTIAEEAARHELVSALSSDTTPRCTCGEWRDSGPSVVRVLSNFHEHRAMAILAALKAARIAVVELAEADSTRYDEGEDAEFPPADRLAWLRGMGMYGVTFWPEYPGEVQAAYNNEPGEPLSVDEARGLAAALLAAADAAEASQ